MSVTVTSQKTIQITDSNGAQDLKGVSASVQGTAYVQSNGLNIGTSPTTITLPATNVTYLHMKNLHATQTVTVTWTPSGGASNVVKTIQPGGLIEFLDANGSGGITALSVVASGASTPIEYILLG